VLLAPVGALGAAIAIGSAQRLGVPMMAGGPHAAFMATKLAYSRRMSGRIIGVSVDRRGKPALRLSAGYRSWGRSSNPMCFDMQARVLDPYTNAIDAYDAIIGPIKDSAKPPDLTRDAMRAALQQSSQIVDYNTHAARAVAQDAGFVSTASSAIARYLDGIFADRQTVRKVSTAVITRLRKDEDGTIANIHHTQP